MANDVSCKSDVELVAEKQGITSTENQADTNADPQLVVDQLDSNSIDPVGAQSPASSSYADCEETDLTAAENSPQKLTIDSNVSVTNEIVTKNETMEMPVCVRKSIDVYAVVQVEKKVSEFEVHKVEIEVTSEAKSDEIEMNDFKIKQPSSNIYDNRVDDFELNIVTSKIENCDLEESKTDHGDSGDSDQSGFETDSGENYRENGDGEEVDEEESVIEKKLDDDEDRRNPQYIPKKGFFYEHDDRTAATSSDEETGKNSKKEAEVKEEDIKGKRRKAVPDGRWQHDLFREKEQSAKSTQELIDIYGYDIRNEESAPKVRRRRKYGRGPNKYTRKSVDETAYGKQTSNRRVRPVDERLSRRKEEYEVEFPALKEDRSRRDVRSRERRAPLRNKSPARESSFSDQGTKYRKGNESRESASRKNIAQNTKPLSSKNRGFTATDGSSLQKCPVSPDSRQNKLTRKPTVVITTNQVQSRNKGMAPARPKRYNSEPRYPESRAPFTVSASSNRSRDPRWSREFKSSKFIGDDEVHDLTHQMGGVDLKSIKRTIIVDSANLNDTKSNAKLSLTEQPSNQGVSTVRSKRYSHQRQSQLPESNGQSSTVMAAPTTTMKIQPLQNVAAEIRLSQKKEQTRTPVPFSIQAQQAAEPALSVNKPSVPSSSMSVSSLISLPTPALTGSAATLQSGAPPLSFVQFYQHPQESIMGYTSQAAVTQLYARDQNVITGSDNQPMQLVAFLPASPIITNPNHSQTAAPVPPPPPPATYPISVISYPQPSQTTQTRPSFANETYSLPPATLESMPQAPEMYQSRGGLTYYNT